jgi:TetR/AcrR family transcriptional regulator, transcriptional repressor for nem operon
LEGGIVMSKALKEPAILVQQVLVLRTFIKMLFAPLPVPRMASILN